MPWKIIGILCLISAPDLNTAATRAVPGGPDGTAVYHGEITPERNREFFETAGRRPLKRLIITSDGGSVEAGIELGRRVHDLGLDIEIAGYCLSSCANYVFTAARRKTIREGAVVAWHGNYIHLWDSGHWTDDVAPRMAKYGEDGNTARRRARREAERLSGLERAFFTRIGVDEAVCRVGRMAPFSVPDYYMLSPGDMARFGIDEVVAPADYDRTDTSGFSVDITFIDLTKP